MHSNIEVITLGETMLRLTPPAFDQLEQTRSLEVHVGGSESNTAVGLGRLGHRVSWLSRLTDNALGRLIADSLRAHNVDVSHVTWTTDDRVGTYYMQRGSPPRAARVIYDRRGSAMSLMCPNDLQPEVFSAEAKLFHTTGITLGISKSAAATALRATQLAQAAGATVSFDFNYRARLWTTEDAKHGCEEIMQLADIIFIPSRDAASVFKMHSPDPEEILELLCAAYPRATVVLTMGARGAAARDGTGRYWYQHAITAREIERLGGGDAFSAGYLASYLEQPDDPAAALRMGAAAAALKYTIPGDLPLFDRDEVESLMRDPEQPLIAR